MGFLTGYGCGWLWGALETFLQWQQERKRASKLELSASRAMKRCNSDVKKSRGQISIKLRLPSQGQFQGSNICQDAKQQKKGNPAILPP